VTLCLVTDRARLSPPGASRAASIERLTRQVARAVEAGVDLIQVRERDLDAGPLEAIVVRCLALARGSRTRILVNDRLDVALAAGAHGIHLRGDSMAPAAVRRLAPAGFLVGRSVHGPAGASADGADYLIAGTVFPSASKPVAAALLGLDGLRTVVRAAHVPVLAIGGLDEAHIAGVAAAGAAGVAAIGLFLDEPLPDIVARVRERFDSVKTAP
jgi:thiamine-phosphate pyrophosphorylase